MVFGDYPDIIKKNAGTKIPALTPRESRLLKGSFDFIGLNHYLTLYVKDSPSSLNVNIRDIAADMGLSTLGMCRTCAVNLHCTYPLLDLILLGESTDHILLQSLVY